VCSISSILTLEALVSYYSMGVIAKSQVAAGPPASFAAQRGWETHLNYGSLNAITATPRRKEDLALVVRWLVNECCAGAHVQ
jgi:hypothetical protein